MLNQIYKSQNISDIEKNQENFIPSKEILDDPEKFFRSQPLWRIKMLNRIIYLSKKHEKVFVNQSKLARSYGKSREWTNKVLHLFEVWGLIHIKYRHKRSCIYTLSSWFKNEGISSRLSHIFKAIRAPMLALMFPLSAASQQFNTPFTHIENGSSLSYYPLTIRQSYIGYSHSPNKINNPIFKRNGLVGVSLSNKGLVMKFAMALEEVEIPLTQWGKVRLTAFPDEVIRFATVQYKKSKGIRDPFAYFFRLCLEYCRDKKIAPDWNLVSTFKSYYGLTEDMPLIEIKPSPVPSAIQYQQNIQKGETEKPKAFRPTSWKPQGNRHLKMTPQCTMDHVQEIENCLSKKFDTIGQNTGLEIEAKSFIKSLIHEEMKCLVQNHPEDYQRYLEKYHSNNNAW